MHVYMFACIHTCVCMYVCVYWDLKSEYRQLLGVILKEFQLLSLNKLFTCIQKEKTIFQHQAFTEGSHIENKCYVRTSEMLTET